MMRNILLCICLFVCMLSCSGNSVDSTKPETYLGTKLVLSDQLTMLSSSHQRILAFFDLEECSSCKLKELQFWDSLLNSLATRRSETNADFDVIFVVNAPKDEELSAVFDKECEIFPVKVFYDADNTFKSENILPIDELYHCFMIDNRNRIKLIGNPIYSSDLSERYLNGIFK